MQRCSGPFAQRRIWARILIAVAMTAVLGASASATSVERSLVGVKIFSPMSLVLKKFGTPTEVRIGSQSTGNGVGAPIGGGGGGMPSGIPGLPPGISIPGGGAGISFPGAGGGGGGGGNGGPAAQRTVVWEYDQPDAGYIEFTFSSDGRVIQIHATGLTSSLVKTARGASLGMKLSDVLNLYGFPEEGQTITGKILTLNYTNRDHCQLQFFNGRLVGVIVAAID
jgi:hypothetical protein